MLILLSLLSLISVSQATTVSELDSYIRQLELKPLSEPTPVRPALFKLGQTLFFDPQLSGKQNISCLSCHSNPGFSADGLPLGLGEGAEGMGSRRHQSQGLVLARHTPQLFNVGLPGIQAFFWDARVRADFRGGWITPEPLLNGPTPQLAMIAKTFDSLLSVQAVFPIANPAEMLGKESRLTNVEAWDETMERLLNGRNSELYKKLFGAAYPGVSALNIAHVGNAIAEFERHQFRASNTPWDLYMRGNKEAMTTRMRRGAKLFIGKANCIFCHTGTHLGGSGVQNVGVPQIGPGVSGGDDKGVYEVTKRPIDLYAFRIPPLRNVALTPPYMHTGVFGTLWDVINHYNRPMESVTGFKWDPRHVSYREGLGLNVRPEVVREKGRTMSAGLVRDLGLGDEERKDLFCFLAVGLTDVRFHKYMKGLIEGRVEDCWVTP